jgi:hypothetical protein
VRQAFDAREEFLVDAEPRHDHDRAGGEAIREDLAEERRQPLLQLCKSR